MYAIHKNYSNLNGQSECENESEKLRDHFGIRSMRLCILTLYLWHKFANCHERFFFLHCGKIWVNGLENSISVQLICNFGNVIVIIIMKCVSKFQKSRAILSILSFEIWLKYIRWYAIVTIATGLSILIFNNSTQRLTNEVFQEIIPLKRACLFVWPTKSILKSSQKLARFNGLKSVYTSVWKPIRYIMISQNQCSQSDSELGKSSKELLQKKQWKTRINASLGLRVSWFLIRSLRFFLFQLS